MSSSPRGASRGNSTSSQNNHLSHFDNIYLDMAPPSDSFARKVEDEANNDSLLTKAFTNAAKNSENIFEVVSAALEKHRVTTGLEELRNEVRTLRMKNSNLKMQLEEMEKMMYANIEDRERVIDQRNEQIKDMKKKIESLTGELEHTNEEKHTLLEDLSKKFLDERSASAGKIGDLNLKLSGLEDFKAKQVRSLLFCALLFGQNIKTLNPKFPPTPPQFVWTDQEKQHEKEKKKIIDEYEGRMTRLMETTKNNEVRWADDIRKQRANMESEVYQKITKENSEENELIKTEHAQMGLELKQQGERASLLEDESTSHY